MYILESSRRSNLRAFLELQNRCSLRWWSSLEYSDQIRRRCHQSYTSVPCRNTCDLWRHCRTVSKTSAHNGQHLQKDFREHQQCKNSHCLDQKRFMFNLEHKSLGVMRNKICPPSYSHRSLSTLKSILLWIQRYLAWRKFE